MTDITLTLPWPAKALLSNARVHWAAKARATAAARREAWITALQVGVRGMGPEAVLEFTLHPPDNRRRDVQNMPGTMKAVIDGIADAMGCDDRLFQCVFPTRFAEVWPGGAVVVRISPGE